MSGVAPALANFAASTVVGVIIIAGGRVIERTRTFGHPLCVGLDPYLDRIPSLFERLGWRGWQALERVIGEVAGSPGWRDDRMVVPGLYPAASSAAGAGTWETAVHSALARTTSELGAAVA